MVDIIALNVAFIGGFALVCIYLLANLNTEVMKLKIERKLRRFLRKLEKDD